MTAQQALERIRHGGATMLTPTDVAPVLGTDPQSIRLQARQEPEKLGFPVVVVGNRTKIPREPFLRFVAGE